MAVFRRIHCPQCNQEKEVMTSANNLPSICSDCKRANQKAEREEYFAKLDKLSTEERLRLVEEWIYDHPRVADHSGSFWNHPIGASSI